MSLDQERFQRLLTAVNQAEKAELSILHNAVIDRMRAYQQSSTTANLKDWQSAKSAQAEAVERLEARYFPSAGQAVTVFAQQKEALEWLKENGFKVSAGKFSQDCRSGHCVVQSDKSIRLQDLKAYASGLSVDRARMGGNDALAARREDADTRRAEAEARIKERQDEEEQRRMDRKWVLRDDADAEICVWVGRLRDATGYHLSRNLLALIHACGGDPHRLAEAQSVIDSALSAAANEIADSDEITVTIEEEE